jgi:hypothetical protein
MVAEIDHSVAMPVGADQRLQLLHVCALAK